MSTEFRNKGKGVEVFEGNDYAALMISNLILIILIIFIGEFAALMEPAHGLGGPWEGFFIGVAVFGALLLLLQLQRRLFKKDPPLWLVNSELLAFLLFFFFVAGGQRLILGVPWAGAYDSGLIFEALFFYLIGLKTAAPGQSLRLMLPLFLPPLLLILIAELTYGMESQVASGLIVVGAIAIILAFSSPILVRVWGCIPLPDAILRERLEAFCRRAHFENGGILLWKVLERAPTAAIVGILPRFRYILLTRQLIKTLSVEEIEAVLAHEIGHNYWKHLLIYPFIFLGLSLCAIVASELLGPTLYRWGGGEGQTFDTMALVMLPLYLIIAVLYFRYVFGYFSRLFERQADLHGFTLGLSADNLIMALDKVAIVTGYTHLTPSWHHYSIQQRIDFLKAAGDNPGLIQRHNLKTGISLVIYLILLAGASWIVVASLFPENPYMEGTAEWLENIAQNISVRLGGIWSQD